jgi:hypothetical protein
MVGSRNVNGAQLKLAATNLKATAKTTARSTTPAQKAKAGGLYKFKTNGTVQIQRLQQQQRQRSRRDAGATDGARH